MAKVAIITRTKNRAVFLKRAIQSVVAQTYSDYEHVIVNDGGDQSAVEQVIAEFSAEVQGKIKLFHRQTSSNAPDTIFNESIDRVDSEYVAIHDDDDTWHPEFLEQAVEILESGAAGVCARTENVYERLVDGKLQTKKHKPYMSDLRAVSLYRQCLDNQLTTICFIYRRSAYQAVGKYDESLPVVADWEFGIRFLMQYDVAYLDPGYPLAFYHRHNKGDDSFAKNDHRQNLTIVLNKYLRQELSEGKLGVGYIMNSLRYEQDMIASTVRRMLPKSLARLVQKKAR